MTTTLSPFEALKDEVATAVCDLRSEETGQVPDDQLGDAYPHLRRVQCAIVRYEDGEIQAFTDLLGDGCQMVLDLKRPKPEIIDIPTLQRLNQG